MVTIYATNISKLPDPKDVPKVMNGLLQARKEKILRCLFVEKRKQSLGAGLLLEYVLNLYGKDSSEIRIGENEKPEIDGFFFNLSHAGDIVLCAVGNQNVGCDIERVSKEPKQIARRCFCKSENEYLDSFKGQARVNEFFRIWTLKESYMKMTGEGMRLRLERMEFVFGDFVQVYRDGIKCSCSIKEYEIPGYKCSVCSEEEKFVDNLHWVDLSK